MEVLCPCCHTAIVVHQEPQINRVCDLCGRSWAVAYDPEDDKYTWICPPCAEWKEQQEQDFEAERLNRMSEEQACGF
jgi:hypothetical protein